MNSFNFKKWGIKNFLFAFLALFSSFSLVGISIFYVSKSKIQAQTEIGEEMEATEEGEKTEIKEIKLMENNEGVNYYLPYPGILPDNPLYWVKMIRDKVLLYLTRKPEVKFDRLLLYADKRIGAAKILIEGRKIQLGLTTATKGEKYLEQAVNQFKKLSSKENNSFLKEKLFRAILKHQEILERLEKNVPDQTKAIIKGMRNKNNSLIN